MGSKNNGARDSAHGLALSIWLDTMYPGGLLCDICNVFLSCQVDRVVAKLV
jgi:hypothetical protein